MKNPPPWQPSYTVLTSDPGLERTSWNVTVIVAYQDAVVSCCCGQVGDSAGTISVVQAADLSLRWTLQGNVQFTWEV